MITYINEISVADYTMLRASAGWPEIPAKQAEVGLSNSFFLVTAKDGKNTVGMTRLISDGGYFAVVVDVVVLPEYQGQGIGREMMLRAICHIKDNMEPTHKNYTILTSAPGKEGFYEKMGFHRVPVEDEGCGMVTRITL